MFDEVIIALTQKFNIEGMKAKVEPLNDSRAEWIYFKNKKELNGTFTIVLHGTQEDIEIMVTKELMEKAKRRIRNFRQKIEQFNGN